MINYYYDDREESDWDIIVCDNCCKEKSRLLTDDWIKDSFNQFCSKDCKKEYEERLEEYCQNEAKRRQQYKSEHPLLFFFENMGRGFLSLLKGLGVLFCIVFVLAFLIGVLH